MAKLKKRSRSGLLLPIIPADQQLQGSGESLQDISFDSPKDRRRSGLLNFFHRKHDKNINVRGPADSVVYAHSIHELPPRPSAISNLLHQIRTLPAMKKSDTSLLKKKKSPLPPRKASAEAAIPLGVRPRSVSDSQCREDGSHSHPTLLLQPQLPLDESGHFDQLGDLSTLSSNVSNGSNEAVTDEPDAGHLAGPQRTRLAIEHIQQKITRTKEAIKAEQTARDENVNEYLKLASNADKQQLQRIKSVFEKKNQKSAQSIAQLQKKLENYHKRVKDLEAHGIQGHRPPKEVLRDVGQGLKDVGANIRDGITGFSGGVVDNIKGGISGLSAVTQNAAGAVMSKPREFASLIKNKFGSADNITALSKQDSNVTEDNHSPSVIPEDFERSHHGSATLTHRYSNGQLPEMAVYNYQHHRSSTKYTSDDECMSVSSGSGPNGLISSPKNQPFQSGPVMSLDPILQELQESREVQQRLQDSIEGLKAQVQQDYALFTQALQEERYRYERLEEQLNDLTELHQNEIENLKQGISDMEEKVQYQSEERLRDMHEMLENCQTRISRIEHQQQHQQLVNIEGLDNSNARALILKLINVVLAVLQVILVLVSTTANLVTPFLKTRLRILTTSLLIAVLVMVIKQWPEFVDIGRYFLGKKK